MFPGQLTIAGIPLKQLIGFQIPEEEKIIG